MTDRELLELAAKAAGIDLKWRDDGLPGYYGDWRGLPQWQHCNPLTDDGDALRLAVKLGMQITIVRGEKTFAEREQGFAFQEHDDDPCAATRRAIVRAAAEIGRAMP